MSFRLKTILGIALIEAILLAILILNSLGNLKTTSEMELIKRADAIATLFGTIAKEAVLSSDMATLESIVREVLRNPGVVYARVKDGSGRVLAAAGDTNALARPFTDDGDRVTNTDGTHDRSQDIAVANVVYGRVEVALSLASLEDARAMTLHQMTLIALMEMVLVALFSFVLGHYLTRQLAGLNVGAQRLAEGDLGYQVPVRGNDELGHTAQAFNEMSQRIRGLYSGLEASEARYRSIMDALGKIGEGLFIVNRAYKVLYMNEAMTRWFGDQTGKTCYASVANLDGQCEYCQLEEVIGEGKTVRYQPTTPDGRTFDIVAVPFLEPGGTVAKLEVVRDITEKKEAERHLHELVDSLARTVGELERFGFIAAHDLQEPLRHIVINTQLLERELGAGISDPVRQHIGTVVESARRMRALVNDLLQYSRVNAESAPFRPFRVSDAVTAATKHLGEAIDAAQARIAVGELPEVVGDQGQITSVFTHLLSNALKFRHPDRTPDITISATRTDERWTFSVRDNGIGIERPYTERVFEVFRRLHTIERYPGTGIGLAVVRRIIERHGGRIWVESEPDTGSTFHFSLPVGEHGGGMPTHQSDTLE